MGFLDRLFRRGDRVATREALTDFLDAQAAFLAQKGMFEYSRARAGPYGNMLFNDKGFLAALELARWRAFPTTLSMIAEAVEGVLREAVPEERRQDMLDAVRAATLAVFDRYPEPAAFQPGEWTTLRRTLSHDLTLIGLHPVKRVMDIPARYHERYVSAMPIHEKLRAKDDATIHNFLRANLCNAHENFMRRADLPALSEALTGPP